MKLRIALLLLLLSFNTSLIAQQEHPGHPLLGKQAPAFKATTLEGVETELEKLKGKVVVINFWATWCRPCRMEFNRLNRLVQKYKGEDVVFLSVTADNKEDVMKLLKKKKLNTTVVPSSRNVLQLYQVQMLPTNMVIDKEGNVTGVIVGYSPNIDEELGMIIDVKLGK